MTAGACGGRLVRTTAGFWNGAGPTGVLAEPKATGAGVASTGGVSTTGTGAGRGGLETRAGAGLGEPGTTIVGNFGVAADAGTTMVVVPGASAASCCSSAATCPIDGRCAGLSESIRSSSAANGCSQDGSICNSPVCAATSKRPCSPDALVTTCGKRPLASS